MLKPDIYESIPDVMHCIVTCFLLGHNESYVESIGSNLKHHYPANRNTTLEHLEEEIIVAWNGPNIPHCDGIVKATIYNMHGAVEWHFHRKSSARRLKFVKISEAVDSLLTKKSTIFLESY